MSKQYSKFKETVFGKIDELSLEERIFNITTFMGMFMCFFGSLVNLILGLEPLIIIAPMLVLLLLIFFYYQSRFKNNYKIYVIPYILTCVGTVTLVWFFNGGLESANIILFFNTLIISILITPAWHRLKTTMFYLIIILICYFVQYYYPNSIIPYKHYDERFYDLVLTIFYSVFVLWGLISYVMDNYHNEKQKHELAREKVELANIELNEKNEMINLQKEELEALNQKLVEINLQILKQNTEFEELNIKLNEANSAKDTFFSIISHDLKNPLSAIKTYIEILKYPDKIKNEQMYNISNSLDKAVNLVCDMLDNLLNWARTQSGKIKYEPDIVLLKSLISNILSQFELAAQNKNVNIINNILDEVSVLSDIYMLRVMITNLISNAIKFTASGGKVQISAHKLLQTGKDIIHIVIKDTGVGISSENISKIFRIDEHHSTIGTNKENGTGIGLILCKEFAEINKGTILVESEVGLGSTFTIEIPGTGTGAICHTPTI
jgi:signal transduction histidine kinase